MTCIIVLGMHRSGTSLVSGILYRLGVDMGIAFRKPDQHNPTGYYEDIDIRDLNKAIFAAAGGRWFNPPNLEDVSAVIGGFDAQVKELVASKSGTWGFKDPRTAFTIHALEPYLPEDLRFIHVLRNPSDVVASLSKRAIRMGYSRSNAHWYSILTRYTDRISDYLRGNVRPVLAIDYGDLVCGHKSFETVQRIARFCDLDWKDDGLIEEAVDLIMVKYE